MLAFVLLVTVALLMGGTHAKSSIEPVFVTMGVRSLSISTVAPPSPLTVLDDPYTNALTPNYARGELDLSAPLHHLPQALPPGIQHEEYDILVISLHYPHDVIVAADFKAQGAVVLECPALSLSSDMPSPEIWNSSVLSASKVPACPDLCSSSMAFTPHLPSPFPAALHAADLSLPPCSSSTTTTPCRTLSKSHLPGTLGTFTDSLTLAIPLASPSGPSPLGALLDGNVLTLSAEGLVHAASREACTLSVRSLALTTAVAPLSSLPVVLSSPRVRVLPHTQANHARLASDIMSRATAFASLRRRLSVGDTMAPSATLSAALDHPVFFQTAMRVGDMVPLVATPATGGLTKPVLDVSSAMMMDAFAQHFVKKIYGTVTTEVSADLSLMLGNALRGNLTNTLGDTLAHSYAHTLQHNLVRVIAPVVSERIQAVVPPALSRNMDRLLMEKVSKHVLDSTPLLAARGLRLSLTHALTRAIAHSLVPVLSHTLGHHANSDYYCHHCYSSGAKQSCALCHFSARSVYYQIYYGAYYADYYSKYYTQYYTHAVRRVDEQAHKTYNNPGATVLPQTLKYLERVGRPIAEGE